MSDEHGDRLDALARAHGADPEALRREVSEFRLALDTDLIVAAAAADEGAARVAADVLAANAGALPGFEHSLRRRVEAATRDRRRRARRRVTAVAVAAGLAGVAGGAAVAAGAMRQPARPSAASTTSAPGAGPAQALAVSQGDTLTYAAAHRLPTPTILAASGALQATVLSLLPRAPRDGELAARLRSLLTAQRAALTSVGLPDAQVEAAIRATDALLARLAAGLPSAVPRPQAPAPASGAPATTRPTTRPTTTPTPTATATPSVSLVLPSPGDAGSSPEVAQSAPR